MICDISNFKSCNYKDNLKDKYFTEYYTIIKDEYLKNPGLYNEFLI